MTTIAEKLFEAGWAAHAEMWGILTGSALVGVAGIACLGFLAWIFILD